MRPQGTKHPEYWTAGPEFQKGWRNGYMKGYTAGYAAGGKKNVMRSQERVIKVLRQQLKLMNDRLFNEDTKKDAKAAWHGREGRREF